MKDWHAAQVIPVTGMVTRSVGTEGRAAVPTAVSRVFKVLAMLYLRDDCLLLNARRKADAVDRGGNLLSSCLFELRGRPAAQWLLGAHRLRNTFSWGPRRSARRSWRSIPSFNR